jgi:hypothetical protein
MKITIERKEKVQMEVQLPLFTKQNYHYYMVEETRTTVLFLGEFEHSIQVTQHMMQYPCSYEQITEKEYNEVYNTIKKQIYE